MLKEIFLLNVNNNPHSTLSTALKKEREKEKKKKKGKNKKDKSMNHDTISASKWHRLRMRVFRRVKMLV